MSYQLNKGETLERGVKRVVVEEINKALQTVKEAAANNPHQAVHAVRKSLKKIRAVVRLIRDEIGEAAYHTENTSYRDAGRHLSDIRDATSMIVTAEKLEEEYADRKLGEAFQVLHKYLEKHRDKLSKQLIEKENILEHVKSILVDVAGRIPGWDISENSFGAIKKDIKRVYRRGYQSFHKLQKKKNQTNEAFHEWRKGAKYLRYHITLIKKIWPSVLGLTSEEIHLLTDYLGDYHDLAVLEDTLHSKKITFKDAKAKAALKAMIEEQKKMLQDQSMVLGRKIYAEKPKAFVRRLKQYWKSAQK